MAKNKSGIVVNIEQNTRAYQIIATLLLCGAVGMIAYALAVNGWVEMAATMLTVFLVQLTTLLFRNGIIGLPEQQEASAFEGTKGLLRTMAADYREWMARSPIWRLASIAGAYTLVFMILRAGMGVALGIFSNVWVAGATAAFLASLIIFPTLIIDAAKSLTAKATAGKRPQDNVVSKEFDLDDE